MMAEMAEKTWWVSYRGEVVQRETKPARVGWSSTIAPQDTPPEFDRETDQWLHLVVSPGGTPVYVQLRVNDAGDWECVSVMSETAALIHAKNARDVYGVGNRHGRMTDMDHWR